MVRLAGIIGLALLTVLVIAYLLLLRELETRTLQPQSARTPSPEPITWIKVQDGRKIAALYFPAPTPETYTVLYSYGNLEDLAGKRKQLLEFHRRGYGAIGYDYEGFGSSEGESSLTAALRDADAVYQYLTNVCKVPPERIIAVGFSMGSGPACYLSHRYPLGGMVLEGGLASVLQVIIPWSGWPGDHFPNSSWLSQSKVPVLIFHGTKDKVVPYRNAEKNYREAAGRKQLVRVPGAGHQDILKVLGEDRYFQILDEFFAANKTPTAVGAP